MSRIAKVPVMIPKGVSVNINSNNISMRGGKGELSFAFNSSISLALIGESIQIEWKRDDKKATAQAGTARAIVSNMAAGVSNGFEKRLSLVGVGYRAQAKGNILNLSLGFSHPVDFEVPAGITIETPSQTEILVKGMNKQQVGEVSAKLRSFRPPEPYKGKGVRYADEFVAKKEAKKK